MLAQSLAIRGRDGTPQAELGTDGLANAILTPSGGRAGIGCGAVLAHTLRAEGFDASEDGTGRGTPIVAQCQGTNVCEMGSLRAGNGGLTGGVPFLAMPLTAREGKGPSSETDSGNIITAAIPRRLTPTECERLQGFPDDWTAWGTREDGTHRDMADGPRYRMLGNAVTVNVVEWIATNVANLTDQ